ncbi:hypothetical protein EYZ11_005564 [Aspergillus tanneri]|uniref:Uncharacterized protein n=1 Tax=Aspergillus tanneri TaxID=1220188 RepID=A0A4S3JI79_9EURO|nr:uncharacterized protein ATNIH1004_000980 [Aspergillus tanneri]KAA8652076.1 hypothetical protein ATNIH1004_000980 [Aspergillus tanneri]THC94970.1 hypothetical protein EYZ11_005564 [Aspergillus tanneri]
MGSPQHVRRLLIFQEARNPQKATETVYLPVNKLGLPICGPGPELPSILELPLRILKAFTDIFNQPKYKGWSVVSAGPYHDTSEEGKYYAVVLEQARDQLHPQDSTDSLLHRLDWDSKKLLIFRKDGAQFRLFNFPGLPLTKNCPIIAEGRKNLVIDPVLLTRVSGVISDDEATFGGFTFHLSFTDDVKDFYFVLLEKRSSVVDSASFGASSADNIKPELADVVAEWTAAPPAHNNPISNHHDWDSESPELATDHHDWFSEAPVSVTDRYGGRTAVGEWTALTPIDFSNYQGAPEPTTDHSGWCPSVNDANVNACAETPYEAPVYVTTNNDNNDNNNDGWNIKHECSSWTYRPKVTHWGSSSTCDDSPYPSPKSPVLTPASTPAPTTIVGPHEHNTATVVRGLPGYNSNSIYNWHTDGCDYDYSDSRSQVPGAIIGWVDSHISSDPDTGTLGRGHGPGPLTSTSTASASCGFRIGFPSIIDYDMDSDYGFTVRDWAEGPNEVDFRVLGIRPVSENPAILFDGVLKGW